MAGSPLSRLFNLGAVGTMSDTQLLDQFLSRRDEAAEAAFEELVSRHGPMVLRVCRAVLCDPHDAEDAFQAVFLVLASRAELNPEERCDRELALWGGPSRGGALPADRGATPPARPPHRRAGPGEHLTGR